MGDVGDQDCCVVCVNVDCLVQLWFLMSYECQEVLQLGFVIFGGGNWLICIGLVSGLNYCDGWYELCCVQI